MIIELRRAIAHNISPMNKIAMSLPFFFALYFQVGIQAGQLILKKNASRLKASVKRSARLGRAIMRVRIPLIKFWKCLLA